MRTPQPRQIIEWKVRRGEQPRYAQELISRIRDFRVQTEREALGRAGGSDFVPIRLATFLEVHLREMVRELVDARSEILERAARSLRLKSIDVSFVLEMNRTTLTVGDLVAHSVSTNDFDVILGTLEGLLPGFKKRLETAHPRWTEERETWPLPPIIPDTGTMILHIKRLLEVRHIVVHELPQRPVFGNEETASWTQAISQFIEACDWIVVEELFGSNPKTQLQMNMEAHERLKFAEDDLQRSLEMALDASGLPRKDWDKVQSLWREFAEVQARLIASRAEGGSMHGMVYSAAMEHLTNDRADQLEAILAEFDPY